MKTIVSPAEDCVRAAAEQILSCLEDKPNAVLALDAGDDALRVLKAAAALARERALPLEGARVFAVCDFEGLAPDDPRSAGRRIAEAFFSGADALLCDGNEGLHVCFAPFGTNYSGVMLP